MIIKHIIYVLILIIFLWLIINTSRADTGKLMWSANTDCSSPMELNNGNIIGTICLYYLEPIHQILGLHWNQNLDSVDSYPVYMGNEITVSLGEVRDVLDDPINYQKDKDGILKNPTIVGTTFTDKELGWVKDEQRCFRLRARVNYGNGRGSVESGYSEAVCTINSSIKTIVYYLDDITMKGAPVYKSTAAPWEFVGNIPPGEHTLLAVANFTGGIIQTKVQATFMVYQEIPNPPTNVKLL